MATWRYGGYWEKYPIAEGGMAVIGGKHYLTCYDLEEGRSPIHAMRGAGFSGAVDVVYVDPPWSIGNVNAFRTKAGLGRSLGFDRLMQGVLREVKASSPLAVFIEMGVKNELLVASMVEELGYRASVARITYYRKHDCGLVIGARGDLEGEVDRYVRLLSGIDDEYTPGVALDAVRDSLGRSGVVYDMCIGRGLTAKRALQVRRGDYKRPVRGVVSDWVVLGNELNKRRLAVSIDVIATMTGEKVVLLG